MSIDNNTHQRGMKMDHHEQVSQRALSAVGRLIQGGKSLHEACTKVCGEEPAVMTAAELKQKISDGDAEMQRLANLVNARK